MSIFDFTCAKCSSTLGSLKSAPLSVLPNAGAVSHQWWGAPFGKVQSRKRFGVPGSPPRALRGARLSRNGSARQTPAPRNRFLRVIPRFMCASLLRAWFREETTPAASLRPDLRRAEAERVAGHHLLHQIRDRPLLPARGDLLERVPVAAARAPAQRI